MSFIYGIPCGLFVTAFMTSNFAAYLAGVVALVICLCTSRILSALAKARGETL